MNHPEQDELQVLRERAYGPDADIQLDPKALERLYELEGRRAGTETVPAADGDVEVPPAPEEPPAPVVDEAGAPSLEPRRPAIRVRRSSVLIALALVALIVVSYTSLVLVQRVQADPLQAGVPQVARLSQDADFEVPEFFASWSAQPDEAQAYQDFYGLRAIINGSGANKDDKCVLVYPSETVTDADGNFTGPAWMGCAAGAFPAAVAFRVDSGFPEQLRDAFPEGTALQFVLDKSAGEIVVFADK